MLVGNIHGAPDLGRPASKKDKSIAFRVDYMRRVIVEALYLVSENEIPHFLLAGNWNMKGQLVRKALERFPSVLRWDVTDTGSKNTWMIANCEHRQKALPVTARHPEADDTWPEVMATFMPLRPRGASEASDHNPHDDLMRHKATSVLEALDKVWSQRKELDQPEVCKNYEVRCKGVARIRRDMMANIKAFRASTPAAFLQVNNK